jgi:hypothetical protein
MPASPPHAAPTPPPSSGAEESRRTAWILALVTLAFGGAMFLNPFGIASGEAFRDNDWLNCRSFDVLSRIALLEYGQFPLRSHLVGGGFPTLAHPSDGSWAPTLLPVLLFGDVLGVKVNLLLLLFAGGWGTASLGRWLGLGEPAARFAGLAMLVSGWAPSMLLVGFYNQAFFLLGPAILALLLQARGSSLLGAGFLYFLVLQQGGHAFPALGYGLGVASLLAAAASAPTLRLRWLHPLWILLGFGAPLAVARYGEAPLALPAGWGLAATGLWLLPGGRAYVAAAAPYLGRLAVVLGTALGLGVGKVVGLLHLDAFGQYDHSLVRHDALWFPSPRPAGAIPWEERYYESLGDFVVTALHRAPASAEYVATWGRVGDPVSYEYAWLGLTPVLLGLALLGGLLAARRGGRAGAIGILGALFLGICFGWHLPPDLHFLLTAGVPRLDAFSQPLKYWNFFVVLSAALLAGVAADWLHGRAPWARWALLAALVWPFVQNQGALRDQFRVPVPIPPREDTFRQVAQVADPLWVELGEPAIREMSDELHLRDYVRAPGATEYVNAQRNVGTIDHYGSVVGAEFSVPARYVTLTGEEVANPRYRGEAWIDRGTGRIEAVRSSPNVIEVDLTAASDCTVVVNQAWLPGFAARGGELIEDEPLLTVQVPAGQTAVRLVYRPLPFLLGLLGSGLALLLWAGALWRLRRRERLG